MSNEKYPLNMVQLLTMAVKQGTSDVHIVPMEPPIFRINREMVKLDYPKLTPENVKELLLQLINPTRLNS
jgi:twitching motility protein PilT